ncbi:hypothetical protein FF38_03903 [Lucilia cuprina]|uniref:DUF4371 domain-containing protein n=1 Tax=Lucilia cuprina TaxID=7375 RepID=A0A0L0C5U0_LUCCU|nr:hypothetical protein CVS40_8799 [Lucilia cuprina]KNC27611.1 hypothetical protein FF38_03903 [Lucilia cuprina]
MEKKYTQKFRKKWINDLKLKEWISECKDPEKAYCKCEINAMLYVLNVHAESKKHINTVERIGSTNQLPFKPVGFKIQQQEASLRLAIIYLSSNLGKIVSTFLSIEELESGSAENIVIGVKNALRNLKAEKLVGIGSDNANVMIGKNKYTALKKDIP